MVLAHIRILLIFESNKNSDRSMADVVDWVHAIISSTGQVHKGDPLERGKHTPRDSPYILLTRVEPADNGHVAESYGACTNLDEKATAVHLRKEREGEMRLREGNGAIEIAFRKRYHAFYVINYLNSRFFLLYN